MENCKKLRCEFCGKEYDNPVDRANCEITCDKQIKLKAEKERQQKLWHEKDIRRKDIDETVNLLNQKLEAYQKDSSEPFAFKRSVNNSLDPFRIFFG